MLDEVITSPSADQPASVDNAWLSVLSNAKDAGLVASDTADRISAHAAMGLLSGTALADAIHDALKDGPAAGKALDTIAGEFAPGDVIELRALDPAGGPVESQCGRLDDSTERQALEAFIRENNGRRNLYLGVNPRRADMAGTMRPAKAEDVVARRAVVLDMDLKDAPDVDADWSRTLDALADRADPALVLNTGNGVQVWLPIEPLTGADVDAASTAAMRDAMEAIGSDDMSEPADRKQAQAGLCADAGVAPFPEPVRQAPPRRGRVQRREGRGKAVGPSRQGGWAEGSRPCRACQPLRQDGRAQERTPRAQRGNPAHGVGSPAQR